MFNFNNVKLVDASYDVVPPRVVQKLIDENLAEMYDSLEDVRLINQTSCPIPEAFGVKRQVTMKGFDYYMNVIPQTSCAWDKDPFMVIVTVVNKITASKTVIEHGVWVKGVFK